MCGGGRPRPRGARGRPPPHNWLSSNRGSARFEDEARLEIEQILLQTNRIAMRVHKALDAVVEAIQLRGTARADRLDRREFVDAAAAPEDRDEQIFVSSVRRNAAPARGVERIHDDIG